MTLIAGTRYDRTEQDGLPTPGEYGKEVNGQWYGAPPGSEGLDFPLVANLSKHNVIEHADGTITVSPSIAISNRQGISWHGYLERGMWRKL